MAPRLLWLGLLIALAVGLPAVNHPASAGGGVASPPVTMPCPEAPRPGSTAWPLDQELTPRAGERVVPVVLHMMRNAMCATKDSCQNMCPSNSPSCLWTPEKVREHFAASGRVNDVWKPYSVRLAVVAVRECLYRPDEFHQVPDAIGPGIPPGPDEDPRLWTVPNGRGVRYNDVNRAFGVDDALNLFLWLRAESEAVDSITYFGSSPRHPRVLPPRRAIVWADMLCVFESRTDPDAQKFTAAGCARKLAHEIGHALTLQHVDEPNAQGPDAPGAFSDCDRLDTAAGAQRNLMQESPTISREDTPLFVELTRWQACQASHAAARFFKPSRFVTR
jgi:hypothetical protein